MHCCTTMHRSNQQLSSQQNQHQQQQQQHSRDSLYSASSTATMLWLVFSAERASVHCSRSAVLTTIISAFVPPISNESAAAGVAAAEGNCQLLGNGTNSPAGPTANCGPVAVILRSLPAARHWYREHTTTTSMHNAVRTVPNPGNPGNDA